MGSCFGKYMKRGSSRDQVKIKENDDICPICMDKKRNASVETCGHQFCYECIVRWTYTQYEFNRHCPLCRQKYTRLVFNIRPIAKQIQRLRPKEKLQVLNLNTQNIPRVTVGPNVELYYIIGELGELIIFGPLDLVYIYSFKLTQDMTQIRYKYCHLKANNTHIFIDFNVEDRHFVLPENLWSTLTRLTFKRNQNELSDH